MPNLHLKASPPNPPPNKGAPNVSGRRDGSACYQAKASQRRRALCVNLEAWCASSTLPLIFASISAPSRRVLITSTGPLVRGTSGYWRDSSIVEVFFVLAAPSGRNEGCFLVDTIQNYIYNTKLFVYWSSLLFRSVGVMMFCVCYLHPDGFACACLLFPCGGRINMFPRSCVRRQSSSSTFQGDVHGSLLTRDVCLEGW